MIPFATMNFNIHLNYANERCELTDDRRESVGLFTKERIKFRKPLRIMIRFLIEFVI